MTTVTDKTKWTAITLGGSLETGLAELKQARQMVAGIEKALADKVRAALKVDVPKGMELRISFRYGAAYALVPPEKPKTARVTVTA